MLSRRSSSFCKPKNFCNLSALRDNSQYSDTILNIIDERTYERKLIIQTNHIILFVRSDYFRSLFNKSGEFQSLTKNGTNKKSIDVMISFAHGMTTEIVEFFFSLFFMAEFRDCGNVDDPTITNIKENTLFLYELSTRFCFDSLTLFCEEQLFGSMTISYFKLLSQFCLIKNQTTGKWSIINERIRIFERLIQWFQFCVEQKPHTDLPATSSSSSGSEEKPKCNYRQYLSCNKEKIMRNLMNDVDNINEIAIPTKSHFISSDKTQIRVNYYRKVCHRCLSNCDDKADGYEGYYFVNFGCLRKNYKDGHEQYSFRLKKKLLDRHKKTDNIIEMLVHSEINKRPRRNSDSSSDMCVEVETSEEEEGSTRIILKDRLDRRFRCETTVSLLSKKLEKDVTSKEDTQKDIHSYSEINNFKVHDEKYCYIGKCDTCLEKKPIYIIQMEINLSRYCPFAMEMCK